MRSPWLGWYAVLVALCTLFLVIDGAMVTSIESAATPAPESTNGSVAAPVSSGLSSDFQPAALTSRHAVLGMLVGALTLGLAIGLSVVDKRRGLSILGWVMVAVIAADGLLGRGSGSQGSTLGILHALLAQIFFPATVAVALFTSSDWAKGREPVPDSGWPSMRTLAILGPLLVMVQIVLGVTFRHRMTGVMPHIVGAMIVTILILIIGAFAVQQFPEHHTIGPAAKIMMGVTFAQVMLGMAAILTRMQATGLSLQLIASTVAHVTGGTLTLTANLILAIQIRRNVYPKPEEEEDQATVIAERS